MKLYTILWTKQAVAVSIMSLFEFKRQQSESPVVRFVKQATVTAVQTRLQTRIYKKFRLQA